MRQLLYLFILLNFNFSFAEPVTEIYQANEKNSQQLIDLLNPVYGSDAKFSSSDSGIIIRGERHIVDEIQVLLLQLDQPKKSFLVQISDSPTSTKRYSSQLQEAVLTNFNVTESIPLIIVQQTDKQQGNVSSLWYKVETLPKQQQALRIELVSSTHQIEMRLLFQTLENGQFRRIENTLSGDFNQWLPIISPQKSSRSATNIKRVGTERSSNLYIKVTPNA
jgi:hypothetical protein|tara:strand:+ start:244 stop:906 length:663 start_codon:yes stop_codon:yes gene_type:complete